MAVSLLFGIHIIKERSLMFEKRTLYVTNFSAQTEGVLEWIRTALESDEPDEISDSIASAQNYLDLLMSTSYAGMYNSRYHSILTEKDYFGTAGSFYHDLRTIDSQFNIIRKNLSENKILSEKDEEYLKYCEEAFAYLFGRIEADGLINEQAIKSDTYLSNVCGIFSYMMLNK